MAARTKAKSLSPPPQSSQRGERTWEIAYLFRKQEHWTEHEYLALDTNRPTEAPKCDTVTKRRE